MAAHRIVRGRSTERAARDFAGCRACGARWQVAGTAFCPSYRLSLDDDTGPRLYASTNGGRIYRYDGKGDFAEMNVRFFPGVYERKEVFVARCVPFRHQVVYVAGDKIIDHD